MDNIIKSSFKSWTSLYLTGRKRPKIEASTKRHASFTIWKQKLQISDEAWFEYLKLEKKSKSCRLVKRDKQNWLFDEVCVKKRSRHIFPSLKELGEVFEEVDLSPSMDEKHPHIMLSEFTLGHNPKDFYRHPIVAVLRDKETPFPMINEYMFSQWLNDLKVAKGGPSNTQFGFIVNMFDYGRDRWMFLRISAGKDSGITRPDFDGITLNDRFISPAQLVGRLKLFDNDKYLVAIQPAIVSKIESGILTYSTTKYACILYSNELNSKNAKILSHFAHHHTSKTTFPDLKVLYRQGKKEESDEWSDSEEEEKKEKEGESEVTKSVPKLQKIKYRSRSISLLVCLNPTSPPSSVCSALDILVDASILRSESAFYYGDDISWETCLQHIVPPLLKIERPELVQETVDFLATHAQALKFAHEIVKRSDYCEWYALADAAMVFCESELPKIGDYIAQKSLASLRKDEGISAIWSPFCIALHSLRSRALRIIGSHQQSCASFVQVVKGMKEFKDYEEHFDVEFYEECLKECAEQMAKLGRIQESIEILSM
ncbi:hypothetical protein ADUPG1_009772 [Aduncisulcus paluster]|uniref:Uncharacterized protein n=1 Tax=Aduncisulcus paluster TaxID=2918883 RepID=A0ABQ5KWQ8_9EUKA|nr:hypothetical protein ADUPG1_009772 [Aduncisulcus paluster]